MKNGWTLALMALGLTAAPAESGEKPGSQPGPAPTHQVTAGPEYKAGGIHRMLFGSGYRHLWVTPIQVEVLDLATFSGGLTPEKKGGGKQTKSLRLQGADGHEWSFRSVDKDPTPVLPEGLHNTFVDRIVQDEISASLPANGLVVDALADAVGLLHVNRRLMVMPDDPRLDKFRQEFAGMLGTIEERPRVEPPVTPGFAGYTKLVDTDELEKLLDADPRERVDSQAFLRARLFDVLIGDYDRHRDQWDWARDARSGRWVPVPRDRDVAFVKFDGLVMDVARRRAAQLVNFDDKSLSVIGLTWQARFLDRRHLADLEWPAWQAAVDDVLKPLTDRVIDEAVRRLPPPYHRLEGARLAAHLKERRSRLPDFARSYYQLLAREAEVNGSDEADVAQLLHRGDGEMEVVLAGPAGPYFRRTFQPSDTKEVRIFLKDGDDRVFSEGRNGAITTRLVGGAGTDVLDDSKGGHTHYYDDASREDRVIPGPGTFVNHRPYTPVLDRQDLPERDWGSSTGIAPTVAFSGDYGVLLGGTLSHTRYGFRRHPFGDRQTLRLGYATRIAGYDARYEYESLRTDSRSRLSLVAKATALDIIHFYGFGNETSAAEPAASDFHAVKERQYTLAPSYRLDLTGIDVSVGPLAKYSDVTPPAGSLLGIQRPYGVEGFGQAGARMSIAFDRRDPELMRPAGILIAAAGTYYPKFWDVTEQFGDVSGVLAVTAGPPGVPGRPTLAVRVAGRRLFGPYPFQEAAAIGGDQTVRGLPHQRYIGDAAAWGNAELRIYFRQRRRSLVPHIGLFGLADAGRVFLEGETSDRWHTSFGGGLWASFLEPRSTFSLTVARSEGFTRVYLHTGLMF
jgi:hypothetical protein